LVAVAGTLVTVGIAAVDVGTTVGLAGTTVGTGVLVAAIAVGGTGVALGSVTFATVIAVALGEGWRKWVERCTGELVDRGVGRGLVA
jgi:6-phosphogluconate dehydrogenase (decarboxylating)